MMMKADRVQSQLQKQGLGSWSHVESESAIRRTYTLPTFTAAVAFVGYVAELAEAADHHPDIDIRYRKVTLTLSTHEAGGLTEKDFDLAAQIDARTS